MEKTITTGNGAVNALTFVQFDERSNRNHLPKLSFSIWKSTKDKKSAHGITFSADVTKALKETGADKLQVAINNLTGAVYFVFGKEGNVQLSKSTNYMITRYDVFSKIADIIKFPHSDAKKPRWIIQLNWIKDTTYEVGNIIDQQS